jgi:hypothetical protein
MNLRSLYISNPLLFKNKYYLFFYSPKQIPNNFINSSKEGLHPCKTFINNKLYLDNCYIVSNIFSNADLFTKLLKFELSSNNNKYKKLLNKNNFKDINLSLNKNNFFNFNTNMFN